MATDNVTFEDYLGQVTAELGFNPDPETVRYYYNQKFSWRFTAGYLLHVYQKEI